MLSPQNTIHFWEDPRKQEGLGCLLSIGEVRKWLKVHMPDWVETCKALVVWCLPFLNSTLTSSVTLSHAILIHLLTILTSFLLLKQASASCFGLFAPTLCLAGSSPGHHIASFSSSFSAGSKYCLFREAFPVHLRTCSVLLIYLFFSLECKPNEGQGHPLYYTACNPGASTVLP